MLTQTNILIPQTDCDDQSSFPIDTVLTIKSKNKEWVKNNVSGI